MVGSAMNKKLTPEFTMTPVKSSQVSHHGYDPASRTLAVTFNTGATYHYSDVAATDYSEMLKAKSIGSHLNNRIKGRFKHKKIGA